MSELHSISSGRFTNSRTHEQPVTTVKDTMYEWNTIIESDLK